MTKYSKPFASLCIPILLSLSILFPSGVFPMSEFKLLLLLGMLKKSDLISDINSVLKKEINVLRPCASFLWIESVLWETKREFFCGSVIVLLEFIEFVRVQHVQKKTIVECIDQPPRFFLPVLRPGPSKVFFTEDSLSANETEKVLITSILIAVSFLFFTFFFFFDLKKYNGVDTRYNAN